MFQRILTLKLPTNRSAFLLGARQTGKSTYLKQCFPMSFKYDLLQTNVKMRLEKSPHLLREEVQALSHSLQSQPIIIDEIQKVPALLDEVHWLIENAGITFILCGSSARQLKRLGTNLLGGRAIRYNFYPLTFAEIPQFDLLKALNNGLLPSHCQATTDEITLLLEAYITNYLNEEIREEGLVRHLPDFARFLDSIAFSNTEQVNYSNITRDCSVSAKTVESYYQILIDTLIGTLITPFQKKRKRDIITKTPKFYLFDTGVGNYLSKRSINTLKGSAAGSVFEQYIFMELTAYINLYKKREDITYWRTKTGLEVDFVIGDDHTAIEVKISQTVHKKELHDLIAFCEEHQPKKAIVVSQDARARMLTINDNCQILILPWKDFLTQPWAHEIT